MMRQWMTTATTAVLSKNGAVRGGEVADAVWRLEHLAAYRRLPISSQEERIARAVRENGVVILVGSTGSDKPT